MRHDVHDGQHALEGHRIHLQRAARALRAPIGDGAVDFAAAQLTRETRAQLPLGRAQLVRQAKARFQEAVIHAAQLTHERAPLSAGFPAREAGHARDHVPLIRLAVPR